MNSKTDLSDAEMDTLTKSCSPTIVITANGEVQTQEEAIVYVKELEKFLTMKALENTPAVTSFGKLCDENGNFYEWIQWSKNHISLRTEFGLICNTENFFPSVDPGLSSSSLWIFATFEDTFKTWSHCSTSSSSAPSSLPVSEIQVREREHRTESDISPVTL